MPDRPTWGTHTTIPWREWILFDSRIARNKATLHSDGAIGYSAANTIDEWTNEHITQCFMGKWRVASAYDGYYAFWKPLAEDFKDEPELQTIHTVGARFIFGVKESVKTSGDFTTFNTNFTFMTADEEIVWNKITGKYYNGIDQWGEYPPDDYEQNAGVAIPGADTADPIIADLPREYHSYLDSQTDGGYQLFNRFDLATEHDIFQDDMFRNGFKLEMATASPGIAASEGLKISVIPTAVRLYYLNGIVNSLSRRSMPEAGGVQLQLNGLGFNIPEADLEDYAYSPGTSYYGHVTYHVYFIGREGQGTYQLDWNLGLPSRDFDQTNTTITIPSMPAMAPGTYHIQLGQVDEERGLANIYTAYAGDWRANDNGRIKPGSRHVFVVGPYTSEPPSPYFKWRWKYDDWLFEYYAPIDVRATETFWDGRVLGVSSVSRGVDDQTGLFQIGDPSVELANHDMHFSQLLSKYICKNQMVEITHGWGNQPEAWHESVFFGIVTDHQLQGPNLNVQLKDWLQRYFTGQLPRFIIDIDTYPNAKDTALGQPIPELLGEHSLTTGTNPGAIEALCVDTINYIYVLAGGPLKSVPQIYADGTTVSSSTYTLYIEEDGKQYVQFDNDQEDNKITFNCQGYIFSDWNSSNGYVQNPAYILAFYLSLLMEVPINFMDLEAIDDLAQIFDNGGWETAGKLAITALEAPEGILQNMLYSFGVKFWQKRDGIISMGRKDISNLATDLFFHTQIEIIKSPIKEFNLEKALNIIQVYWNHFPAADIYAGARTTKDEASIKLFERELGAGQPWYFPCVTAESLVQQRVLEDLLKIAYGDKRIKIDIPMTYIADIEIFDNIRVQDPYGLSWTKSGEIGRYYYVLNLTYDWLGRKIGIEAADLQWLLQQYFIFGDEDAMPELWTDARPTSYSIYGYLCDEDTFQFSDGTAGKILIDENLVEQE